MRRLVQVVKYGGSILAYSEKEPAELEDLMKSPETYMRDESEIRRIARETLYAWQIHSKEKEWEMREQYELWMSHGVKQYGHSVVGKIGIVPEVRKYCRFFSDMVVEIFRKEGLPVEQIDPAETVKWNERLKLFEVEELLRRGKKVIESGRIPISWGTVVDKIPSGYAIMSGDDFVTHVALLRRAEEADMYLDVPVCDKNPKRYRDARPLKVLRSAENLAITVDERDKTGGLIGKIKKMELPAMSGTRCQIVNATKRGNVYFSLMGEHVGTLIKPEI